MKNRIVLTIGLGCLLAAGGISQATIITNIATVDSTIRIGSPTLNFGADALLNQGDYVSPHTAYRSLMQFDLSSSPVGQNVLSATLRLQLAPPGTSNPAGTANIYRLTNSWNEAQASWNNRLTSTPWSSAGGDYAGTVYASATLERYLDVGAKVYNVDVTSLVQGWVYGTYANNGLVMVSTSEGTSQFKLFYFESTESLVGGAVLPQLVLEFGVPEPSLVSLAAVGVAVLVARRRRQ
jgi:hypothetical protein